MKVLINLFDLRDHRYTIQGSSMISHLKRESLIIQRAKHYVDVIAKFHHIPCPKFRLEFFTDNNFYGDPYKTLEIIR